jgi:peptidoglycan/xylan/chitin deacetylase (PgdA/CDA1 family)
MTIRQIIRDIILDFFGIFSKPKNGIHILNAHRVSLNNPNKEVFQKQLEQLQKYVKFIRFEEAVDLITSKTKVNEPLVAFSFDDGLEECYTHIAPVLENFNTNAAFFINPNFVEANDEYIENFTQNTVKMPDKKPMNWAQINDLKQRGHIIGSHTLDHYNINTNDTTELTHQIVDSKKIIEQKTGIPCPYFAFPFGRLEHVNKLSIDIACEYYPYIFSQSNYKNYFSFAGKVINRRHFEPDWKVNHVKFFLSVNKKYPK